MVLRAEAGRAVVPAAMGQAGAMEGGHLRPGSGLETPVALVVEVGAVRGVDGQAGMGVFVLVAAHAIAEGVRAIIDLVDTERVHHRVVERAGLIDGGDGDGNVIEYEHGGGLRNTWNE